MNEQEILELKKSASCIDYWFDNELCRNEPELYLKILKESEVTVDTHHRYIYTTWEGFGVERNYDILGAGSRLSECIADLVSDVKRLSLEEKVQDILKKMS